jgi:hypothetical protein
MKEIRSEKVGIGHGSSALARDRKSSKASGQHPFNAQARAASWACLWQR